MVADIDWYLRAVSLLKGTQQTAKSLLDEYKALANKQRVLYNIPSTVRNNKTLDKTVNQRIAIGKTYDKALQQVLVTTSLIQKAKFHPPKKSWRAMAYWLYCCIKYRNL